MRAARRMAVPIDLCPVPREVADMLATGLVLVTRVRYMGGHVLWLRFSDGLSGEVDLAHELRGDMLAPFRDPQLFAQARVEHGTVVWPNGLDWSPEALYEQLRSVKGLPSQSDDDRARERLAHAVRMPEISRFFGIVIRMFATEHGPPHFDAIYGEYQISVTIADGVVSGRFPRTALRLVLEWSDLHQPELLANWERLRDGQSPRPIQPLK